MALPVSSTCQREHIAQSIIYTLSGRLFLVAPSLEKGRTSFRDAQHLLQQYALSTLGLPSDCSKCRCTVCAFGDQYLCCLEHTYFTFPSWVSAIPTAVNISVSKFPQVSGAVCCTATYMPSGVSYWSHVRRCSAVW